MIDSDLTGSASEMGCNDNCGCTFYHEFMNWLRQLARKYKLNDYPSDDGSFVTELRLEQFVDSELCDALENLSAQHQALSGLPTCDVAAGLVDLEQLTEQVYRAIAGSVVIEDD